MRAELVRVGLHQVDIKIVTDDEQMHVLQWRRNLLWDEVLLDALDEMRVLKVACGDEPFSREALDVVLLLLAARRERDDAHPA